MKNYIPKTKKRLSEEHKHNLSISHKGKKPWNTGKIRVDMIGDKNPAKNPIVGKKISEAKFGKLRPDVSGKNCHFWKGGLTKESTKIRQSLEYRLWRKSVFERDNFTCVWCLKHSGILHADHIKPFSLYPELRFAIDNGRTLCIECHKTTDTYLKNYKKNEKS